jgi:competence protein ComGA
VSLELGERLISHLKFRASMDIGERRRPQSGSFEWTIDHHLYYLRISTLPTLKSKESLVIRLLPQKASMPLQKLSLFPFSSKKLLALLQHSHGLLIHTGPTGSGKTTTLYSMISHCTTQLDRHVITLEDPIEKENDQVLQVQVNEKAGITYSTGLKAILRSDPDVIMIGEIRDQETAQIAVSAALTGHLVLTTLHASDAKGAIYRLMELGIKWHEINQALIGITAQRLVEVKCPFCGEDCSPFCTYNQSQKRAIVYEILHGLTLKSALKTANGEITPFDYLQLKDLLRKGIALGYLSEKVLARFHE